MLTSMKALWRRPELIIHGFSLIIITRLWGVTQPNAVWSR